MSQQQTTVATKATGDAFTAAECNNITSVINANATDADSRITLGGSGLLRSDGSGTVDTALVTGVEWYAPLPYSMWGAKARCQYFSGSFSGYTSKVLLADGLASEALGMIGRAYDADSFTTYAQPFGFNATLSIGLYRTAAGNLTIECSNTFTGASDNYNLLIFYLVP